MAKSSGGAATGADSSPAAEEMTTRELLVRAAGRSIAAHGFAGSRLVDITADAGVTTGAFYRYFDGKDHVANEVLDTFDGRLVEALDAAPSMTSAFAEWLRCAASHPGALRVAFELARPGTDVHRVLEAKRAGWAAALAPHLAVPRRLGRTPARFLTDLLFQYSLFLAPSADPDHADVAETLAHMVTRGIYIPDAPRAAGETTAAGLGVPRFDPHIHWERSSDKVAPRSVRGMRTWQSIRESAVEVFGERGLTDATVLDIATHAGVASGTVYRYFVDKEDIFRSLQASAEEAIIRDSHLPMEDGRLAIKAQFLAYVAAYERHLGVLRAWQELMQPGSELAEAWDGMRSRFIERAARVLRHGQREGQVDDSIDAHLAAAIYSIGNEAAARALLVLRFEPAGSHAQLADMLERLLIGGFQR
ncbi:TetR/AcrR family transcriptional regulator [Euzebya sp.]|uniref:TetR/AcrR family transcriptional regulator n=1 Tax=Euzebya sp. TaxID=1971409 RepID=UPI003514A2A3